MNCDLAIFFGEWQFMMNHAVNILGNLYQRASKMVEIRFLLTTFNLKISSLSKYCLKNVIEIHSNVLHSSVKIHSIFHCFIDSFDWCLINKCLNIDFKNWMAVAFTLEMGTIKCMSFHVLFMFARWCLWWVNAFVNICRCVAIPCLNCLW